MDEVEQASDAKSINKKKVPWRWRCKDKALQLKATAIKEERPFLFAQDNPRRKKDRRNPKRVIRVRSPTTKQYLSIYSLG
jgi:hypothetical protein